jgi:hypothetical protein
MNAPLSLAHDAPLRRASLVADWRVALRLLAGAALFGVIVGSIG